MTDYSISTYLKKGLSSIYTWLLVLVVVANVVFSNFPGITETIYSNGIYQIIRYVYDYTFGFLPFAMIYVLFTALVLGLMLWIRKLIGMEGPFLTKLFPSILLDISRFLIVVVFLFYFLWGFNYQRIPFAQQLELHSTQVEKPYLLNELQLVTQRMDSLRAQILPPDQLINESHINPQLESLLRNHQTALFSQWNLPAGARVRIRKLQPRGTLLRISTAGVYIPFSLEGHIDNGLHPMQWPATMAHEMAHGYGRTDEGVCNFIGMLTCLKSDDAMIQYSGWMMYLRYLLRNIRKLDRANFQETFDLVPEVIVRDIKDIQQELAKYPDIFPQARDVIYDQYLKTHGVKEGLVSYSTIIQMACDWKQSKHNDGLMD